MQTTFQRVLVPVRLEGLAVALTLAAALLLAGLGPARADGTLALATGNDYKPFTDQSLADGGFATDLVLVVLDRAGYDHTLQWVPWKRAETGTAETQFTATFPYFKTEERATVFHYSDPIYTVEARLFAAADAPDAGSVAELEGRTLCVPLGYAVATSLEDAVGDDRIKRDMPPEMSNCFKKLAAGRVDMVEASVLQGWDLVDSLGIDRADLKLLSMVVDENTLHFIVSRSLPQGEEIIAAFNQALAEVKADGTYDALIAKHGLPQ